MMIRHSGYDTLEVEPAKTWLRVRQKHSVGGCCCFPCANISGHLDSDSVASGEVELRSRRCSCLRVLGTFAFSCIFAMWCVARGVRYQYPPPPSLLPRSLKYRKCHATLDLGAFAAHVAPIALIRLTRRAGGQVAFYSVLLVVVRLGQGALPLSIGAHTRARTHAEM